MCFGGAYSYLSTVSEIFVRNEIKSVRNFNVRIFFINVPVRKRIKKFSKVLEDFR